MEWSELPLNMERFLKWNEFPLEMERGLALQILSARTDCSAVSAGLRFSFAHALVSRYLAWLRRLAAHVRLPDILTCLRVCFCKGESLVRGNPLYREIPYTRKSLIRGNPLLFSTPVCRSPVRVHNQGSRTTCSSSYIILLLLLILLFIPILSLLFV